MSSLRFHEIGGGRIHLALAVGAALVLLPGAAFASHHASSTRSGGGVSHGGHSSGHSSSGSSHSSSGHSSSSSHSYSSNHGGGSYPWGNRGDAVPRNGHVPGSREPHFGHDGHHGGHGGVIIGGPWWWDPWFYDGGYGYGYGPYGYGYGWRWGWSGWWWPGPGAVYGEPGYGRGYGDGDGDGGYGALDLDVEPESAEVYVDGQPAGTCDDFDGWPQYLWLPEGEHDIAIYRPGFRTISRVYTIYPGRVIEVDDHMDRGEAVRPEDLPAASTARRDDRLRRNEERAEAARRRDGSWRDRDDRPDEEDMTPSQRREERNAEREAHANAQAAPGTSQLGVGQGHVHLRVTPSDASVYLDGTFIGTASQVASAAGMVVTPGKHRLEVVRPGYASEHADFDASPGETVEVKVDLDED